MTKITLLSCENVATGYLPRPSYAAGARHTRARWQKNMPVNSALLLLLQCTAVHAIDSSVHADSATVSFYLPPHTFLCGMDIIFTILFV